MQHGVYINEIKTATQALTTIESGIVIAVGTSKIPQKSPVLCHNLTEFVQKFGDGGTLAEVANAAFSIYNISPVVFINAFNPEKHFAQVEEVYEGVRQFSITDLIEDSVQITTGEKIAPTQLVKDTDFTVGSMYLHGQDNDPVIALEFLNTDKIVDGKFKVTYRKASSALGGTPEVEEVELAELEDNIWELTDDTILESVTVETGGVDTLADVPFEVAQDSTGASIITVPFGANLVDDKLKLSYKVLALENVTAEDIIGGVDAATGEKYGLELIDAVPGKLGLNATFTIIAPGFSQIPEVAAAITGKAKAVGGVFPSIAIADIDAANYQSAIEWKNTSGLASPFLIYTYPKVQIGGTFYRLSTHLACVMNVTDANNAGLPYVSPSNQRLQISGAVNENGVEVFLDQSQANSLNEVGIVTALYRNGWRAWGNYTSTGPDEDFKDRWISVRRLLNFIEVSLDTNYFSNLDAPINRRNIDSILQSANLYLASLQSADALLGAELEFNEADNSTSDLMAGKLTFNLRWLSPPPSEAIIFKVQVDTSYFSNLFA